MATRKVQFTLRGEEAQLALAFQRHCHYELGMSEDLNTLVRRVFMNFLHQNVDRQQPTPDDTGVVSASGEANDTGDVSPNAEQSAGPVGHTLADTPVDAAPAAGGEVPAGLG